MPGSEEDPIQASPGERLVILTPQQVEEMKLNGTLLPQPPEEWGFPVLGATPLLIASPYSYVKHGISNLLKRNDLTKEEHESKLFSMKWLSKAREPLIPAVVVISPEILSAIFDPKNRKFFLNSKGYAILGKGENAIFGDSLMDSDGDIHQERRSDVLQALTRPENTRRFQDRTVSLIQTILDRQYALLGERGSRVGTFEELAKNITFELSMKLFLGLDPADPFDIVYINRFKELWPKLAMGIIDISGIESEHMPHYQAIEAKGEVEGMIAALIKREQARERIMPGYDPDSTLGSLVLIRPHGMTDEDIQNHMRLLVYAGYDTTKNTMCWLMHHLLDDPRLMQRAKKEARALSGESYTSAFIHKQIFFQHLVEETVRLHPQVHLLPRWVDVDIILGGYFIPKGTLLIPVTAYMHRQKEFFGEDADIFTPDRWNVLSASQLRHEMKYLPFGTGEHACIGEDLAHTEIVLAFILLLQRFNVSKSHREPPFAGRSVPGPLSKPFGGVPIQYNLVKQQA